MLDRTVLAPRARKSELLVGGLGVHTRLPPSPLIPMMQGAGREDKKDSQLEMSAYFTDTGISCVSRGGGVSIVVIPKKLALTPTEIDL